MFNIFLTYNKLNYVYKHKLNIWYPFRLGFFFNGKHILQNNVSLTYVGHTLQFCLYIRACLQVSLFYTAFSRCIFLHITNRLAIFIAADYKAMSL